MWCALVERVGGFKGSRKYDASVGEGSVCSAVSGTSVAMELSWYQLIRWYAITRPGWQDGRSSILQVRSIPTYDPWPLSEVSSLSENAKLNLANILAVRVSMKDSLSDFKI